MESAQATLAWPGLGCFQLRDFLQGPKTRQMHRQWDNHESTERAKGFPPNNPTSSRVAFCYEPEEAERGSLPNLEAAAAGGLLRGTAAKLRAGGRGPLPPRKVVPRAPHSDSSVPLC